MSTGIRIQERREELGLSRQQLATRLGTSRRLVWRVESGARQLRVDELPAWSAALETTQDKLLAPSVESAA